MKPIMVHHPFTYTYVYMCACIHKYPHHIYMKTRIKLLDCETKTSFLVLTERMRTSKSID